MPRRSGPSPASLAAMIGALTLLVPVWCTCGAQDSGSFDASVRALGRSVTIQRDGSHLSRLFALRQLHDPALASLFHRIALRDGWQLQVHAILGLAEIDETSHIDPYLVTQVDEHTQEALIANAIDMKLIGHDQMRELLASEEVAPITRLLVAAELIVAGETVDEATIATFAGAGSVRVGGLASLLLAKLGDPAAFDAHVARLEGLPRRERERHRAWLFEAARQYEVAPLAPWLRRTLEAPGLDDESAYWALFTLLAIAPESGMPLWEQALGEDPSYRDQVRYGMLLLAAGPDVPASAYDRLGAGQPLVLSMADVGRALSSGADPSAALIALVDVQHPRTMSWAIGLLDELPREQAARVYWHLLDMAENEGIGRDERIANAVGATARLVEIDPDRVLQRLAEAEDDSLAQQVLLLGLFETTSPAVGAAARRIRRIGAGPSDALTLLLIARHAGSLERRDLEMLGRIAAGGARLSEGAQVQAAWLYLRHTAATDRALAAIFEDS